MVYALVRYAYSSVGLIPCNFWVLASKKIKNKANMKLSDPTCQVNSQITKLKVSFGQMSAVAGEH